MTHELPPSPPTTPTPQHAVATTSQASAMATTSLILGIMSYLFCPLAAAIPAVICGHIGRAQIRSNPNLTGDGMAVAGLVLGYIQILLTVIGVVIFILLALLGLAAGAAAQAQ